MSRGDICMNEKGDKTGGISWDLKLSSRVLFFRPLAFEIYDGQYGVTLNKKTSSGFSI